MHSDKPRSSQPGRQPNRSGPGKPAGNQRPAERFNKAKIGPLKGKGPSKPATAFVPARPDPTDWNDVAGWYDQHVGDAGGEYHQHVVLPGVVRLLQLNGPQAVLDVACGQGVLCRTLAQKQAQVTGIDAAPDLIRAARERGPRQIDYRVGDARDLSALPADHFKAAACVLAIQNIHPIGPVFSSVSRVLQPGGRFVMVMMHPCFRGAKESHWGWDEQQKAQYRRIDRYLVPRKTPIVTHPGKDPDGYTWTFHKPIEAYVNALRRAGLLIDAMEEWASHKTSEAGPRAAAENLARKEIPMFLAIRAIKIANAGEEGELSVVKTTAAETTESKRSE